MNQVALGILLLLTKYDDHYSYLTSHPTPPPTQPSIGRWPVLSQAEPSINNSVDYSGWDSEGESGWVSGVGRHRIIRLPCKVIEA